MTTATRPEADLDALCVNTIRTLSMDAVQAASDRSEGGRQGLRSPRRAVRSAGGDTEPPSASGLGRAAWAFVRLHGERVRAGRLRARGVPTSEETARVAKEHGMLLVRLREAGEFAVTADGIDEVGPNLDLIKGFGRAETSDTAMRCVP